MITTLPDGFICSNCMVRTLANISHDWETTHLWCDICKIMTKWIKNPKYDTNKKQTCYNCKAQFNENLVRCPLCNSTALKESPGRIKMEARNGLKEFYILLEEAANIHDSKSHDYASNSDPLGNYRFAGNFAKLFKDDTDSGLIGRFAEKLYRLHNLERDGKNPNNESIRDTETDMLVIIGLFVANRRKRRNDKSIS